VLASALKATLNRSGTCSTKLDNQIKTVDDYTLTIKSIKLAGSVATARVQTKRNGSNLVQTVTLAREKAGWRITSVASA
jgi:Putative lumazine-binding